MAQQYLIDTNSVIDYLGNKLPVKSSTILDNTIIQLSIITRIELLAWSNATQQQIQILQNFITSSVVYNLNETTIIETINIRKKYKIKLPDAIIAATALTNNLTLFTRNTSDFRMINGLDIFNPF